MTREELFEKAMDAYEDARTVEEGVQAVIDVVEDALLTEGMSPADDPLLRNANGTGPKHVRSFRASDEIWEAAKERAASEGVSISQVIVLLLLGYAQGLLDLPEHRAVIKEPV